MNEDDINEIEREQLEYLRRNTVSDTEEPTLEYPEILKNPRGPKPRRIREESDIDREELQRNERRILPIPRRETERAMPKPKFTFARYFDILSDSFVNIMDDLLNFSGDIEELPGIFTKDERLVLVGTIIMIVSIYIIFFNKNLSGSSSGSGSSV